MKALILCLIVISSLNLSANTETKVEVTPKKVEVTPEKKESVKEEKKEDELNESAEEFKGSKYLQVDKPDIPDELKVIEDQILQNAIDVIILTGKHTVVYSQKREEGYNKNYKNFHGLQISIFPFSEQANTFSLKLFYYNWITRKFDKVLNKKISKYNVLNEMRFAMYELFNGAEFIKEHKDLIEKKNFQRIQQVRKMVEEQQKRDRKKKLEDKEEVKKQEEKKKEDDEKKALLKREEKKKRQDKEKLEDKVTESQPVGKTDQKDEEEASAAVEAETVEITKNKEKNTARGGGRKKKKKKSDTTEDINENVAENPISPEEVFEKSETWSKEVEFSFMTGFRQEVVETQSLLSVKTNLRYISVGANYKTLIKSPYPWGYRFVINAGYPIKTDKYQISVYRSLEAGVFKPLLWGINASLKLEHSSLPFVNLPDEGKGLKVIQNDILYGKLGLDATFEVRGRKLSPAVELATSLSAKSSVGKTITTQRTMLSLQAELFPSHSLALSFFNTEISGQITGQSSGGSVLYSYMFGN